jgi:hypothetical protein
MQMIALRRIWIMTVFAMATPALAIEITPLISFHQDAGIGTAYETNARIDEGAGFGLMVSFDRRDDLRLDVLYLGQRSELTVDDPDQTPIEFPIDIEVHYLQLGGRKYFRNPGAVRPYLGGALGAGMLRPDFSDTSLRFSFSFGGGADLMMTDRIGLRLDARWFGLLFGESVGVSCGPGCDGSLDAGGVNQFVIAAGVVVKTSQKAEARSQKKKRRQKAEGRRQKERQEQRHFGLCF